MIHALPGMGADHRMYPADWNILPDLHRCEWVRHNGEQSLAEVAESMILEYRIQPGDTLIGTSLGGMVSCEIAKIIHIESLLLIGSATNAAEVNSLLSFVHPLAKYAPIDWLRFSAGKIPVEVAQMFVGIETSFVRAMCNAIFSWEGVGDLKHTRLSRIHGRFDIVIPPPAKVDLLLNGGHLITMTHAQQCAEYANSILKR